MVPIDRQRQRFQKQKTLESTTHDLSPLSTKMARRSGVAMDWLRNHYEEWVRENESTIKNLEATVNQLSFFIPDRFATGEVLTEAVLASADVITLYHDRILNRHRPDSISTGSDTPFSTRIKNLLALIRSTQVLLEILARRRVSRKWQWRIIFFVETLKAACRLTLLHHNGGHMLVTASEAESRVKCSIQALKNSNDPMADVKAMYLKSGRSPGISPHGIHSTLGKQTRPLHMLRMLSVENGSEFEKRRGSATSRRRVGEALHILRPVIYVGCIMAIRRKGWRPLIISFLIDVISQSLLRSEPFLSECEARESANRSLQWFFYLLRDPILTSFSRKPLSWILSWPAKIPLFGIVFANMDELLKHLPSHYFWTNNITDVLRRFV